MTDSLIEYLSQFITQKRLALFDEILARRTRYVRVVLEDIYQPHNASAVMRTMDCFGIQDAYIVENRNEYIVNPDVALGASKWLSLKKYNKSEENTINVINDLRNEKYRIVATTPHTHDTELDDFDMTKGKVALFFGTEMHGLSDKVLENSDEFIRIPMYGFTESFNISVSAAIILHHLTAKLRNLPIDWKLSDNEIKELKLDWLKKSIKRSDLLINKFLSHK